MEKHVRPNCRSPCGERGLKYFRLGSICRVAMPSRSPCGERGLKFCTTSQGGSRFPSLPVRGAWIEIVAEKQQIFEAVQSLPVRGAWIEMAPANVSSGDAQVAPRAGSGD